MKNNKFKQVLNLIDYDTYEKLCNILGITAIGTGISASTIFSEYPILNNSLHISSWILLIAYNYLSSSSHKDQTKDINEIKKLYNEFLNNYNVLNKVFNLNNPIEIHTMFNYLLYKGYLSQNKSFEFSKKEARDITPILGTNIIMGKGVCRHISSTLKDILNNYNINACNLGCYQKDNIINISVLKEEKYSKEELYSWLRQHNTDEHTFDMINHALELIYENGKFAELTYKNTDTKNIIKRLFSNHLICFAHKDGFNYCLDPTQFRIYRLSDNGTLYDFEENNIKIKNSITFNNKDEYKIMKSYLNKYPSISLEEEKELITKTTDICKNNIDIFENFYNENSLLYDEITNKLMKVKRNPYAKLVK